MILGCPYTNSSFPRAKSALSASRWLAADIPQSPVMSVGRPDGQVLATTEGVHNAGYAPSTDGEHVPCNRGVVTGHISRLLEGYRQVENSLCPFPGSCVPFALCSALPNRPCLASALMWSVA